ncbi:MAG TPA: type II toxin-antitoxin system RelE/ParE family toxin [Lacipirellulaceae bacterium]
MRYRISSLARLDLDDIHDYIAHDNPDAAKRWLRKTMDQFARLAKNPICGDARDDIRPDVRSVSHGNYVIFFRSREDYLEIVRVIHGARDIEGLL